jgi:hypothetical protein
MITPRFFLGWRSIISTDIKNGLQIFVPTFLTNRHKKILIFCAGRLTHTIDTKNQVYFCLDRLKQLTPKYLFLMSIA